MTSEFELGEVAFGAPLAVVSLSAATDSEKFALLGFMLLALLIVTIIVLPARHRAIDRANPDWRNRLLKSWLQRKVVMIGMMSGFGAGVAAHYSHWTVGWALLAVIGWIAYRSDQRYRSNIQSETGRHDV